jgi:hypothetical protein
MAKSTSSTTEVVVERFHLLSIAATTDPSGGAGDDWFTYRIAQGKNLVTGYRCGGRHAVTAEVERIVEALNERLLVKGRRYNSTAPPAKPPPRHKDLS